MSLSLTCRRCGASFIHTAKRGRPPAYCSTECRPTRGDGVVRSHSLDGYRRGCRCNLCKAAKNDTMRAYFRAKGGNPYWQPTPKVPCAGGCGKEIRQGMCRACAGRPISPRWKAAKAKQRAAACGSRSTWAWMQGHCAECGEEFCRRVGRTAVPFCSSRCRLRDQKARRRALEAGVKITPGRRYAVHERDGWICQLCDFAVDREAKVPAFEAPVIDHIIPLAAGGEHGPDNWQTAHFWCNSYKRDLDMAEVV